jgi:hypothetical protein
MWGARRWSAAALSHTRCLSPYWIWDLGCRTSSSGVALGTPRRRGGSGGRRGDEARQPRSHSPRVTPIPNQDLRCRTSSPMDLLRPPRRWGTSVGGTGDEVRQLHHPESSILTALWVTRSYREFVKSHNIHLTRLAPQAETSPRNSIHAPRTSHASPAVASKHSEHSKILRVDAHAMHRACKNLARRPQLLITPAHSLRSCLIPRNMRRSSTLAPLNWYLTLACTSALARHAYVQLAHTQRLLATAWPAGD